MLLPLSLLLLSPGCQDAPQTRLDDPLRDVSQDTASFGDSEGQRDSSAPPSDSAPGSDSLPSGDSQSPIEPDQPPALELVFEAPPFTLPEGARFAPDLAYDEHADTLFDIFLPTTEEAAPLLIYIHGGGFRSGDKADAYGSQETVISSVLQAGAAYASLNYRLLEETDSEGVIKCLSDSRRALQFIRYHHETLGVDPELVFLYGGSAGAGTALWLGSHDDMAEPESMDLIERESTRVLAVGLLETQATYDLFRWEEIFAPYKLSVEDMSAITEEQRLFSFYGVSSWKELETAATEAYRAEVDMLSLLDADDAPIWLASRSYAEARPEDTGSLYHHPYHGLAVRESARAVGLEEVSYLPELGIEDPSGEDMLPFFARQLSELKDR